jgi:hypothetical protein
MLIPDTRFLRQGIKPFIKYNGIALLILTLLKSTKPLSSFLVLHEAYQLIFSYFIYILSYYNLKVNFSPI